VSRAVGYSVGPDAAGHGAPIEVDGWRAVGEVTLHNRPALAALLAAAGDPAPDGAGDLEMLVRCFVRIGPAGLRAANGMFTVAMSRRDELVLIRDHVGTRTAYYAHTPRGWAAASSLRALRGRVAPAGFGWRVDLPAVATFLTFAYLPGSETLVEGVAELLPGRITRLGPGGAVTSEPFWEPQERIDGSVGPAQLRDALEWATAARLPGGRPVAVTLSGGVDSSLVTALAAKLHTHPVHTYSISFGDELPNELAYSGLVAAHCGSVHRVLRVDGAQVAGRLGETVALLDNPVGDPLTVPNLMLAEAMAADGMTVALNGEGGDPVFGGRRTCRC
jgi:asparagine synthase (glutamine-hydrolysing)